MVVFGTIVTGKTRYRTVNGYVLKEKDLKKISALIRPFKLEDVKAALVDSGVAGMTISEVRGFGRQLGTIDPIEGSHSQGAQLHHALLQKLRLEIVVDDNLLETALAKLTEAARTGEIGDGKVFVTSVESAMRIRTGESGAEVL